MKAERMGESNAPKDFLLLTGCARSGTTFLATLMETSFDMAIPVESFFVPHFARFIGLWGDLAKIPNLRSLISAIREYLIISLYFIIRAKNREEAARFTLLDIIDDVSARLDGLSVSSYPELLDAFYRAYAMKRGRKRWGEKGMNYDIEPLELYDRSLPRMKVIHMVRDGRDVCLSWRKTWFGPKSTAEAAVKWRDHVNHYRTWGGAHPERYCEVRYEDLLEDPQKTMGRIKDFLGLENAPENITPPDEGSLGWAKVIRNESHHRLIGQQLQKDNRHKWRSEMPTDECLLFQHIAGHTLEDFGYDVLPGGAGSIRFFGRVWTGRVKGMLTLNYILRRVRKYLPVILWAAQKVHIHPSKLWGMDRTLRK